MVRAQLQEIPTPLTNALRPTTTNAESPQGFPQGGWPCMFPACTQMVHGSTNRISIRFAAAHAEEPGMKYLSYN